MPTIKDPEPGGPRYVFTAEPWRITPAVKNQIIINLTEHGNEALAAQMAGCSHRGMRNHMEADLEFAESVKEAKALFAAKRIEAEMIRRGIDGVDRPVYQGGVKVGDVREYSDGLLLHLAKKYDPEMRDRLSVDVNVKAGVLVVYSYMDQEQWEKWADAQSMSPNPLEGLPGIDAEAISEARKKKAEIARRGYEEPDESEDEPQE